MFLLPSLSVFSQKLTFIENNGLSKDSWKYVLRNAKSTVYFYDNYFVIQTFKKIGDSIEFENIPIYFENKKSYVLTDIPTNLESKTYRFQSNSQPSTSSHFESIVYKNIAKNVDCRFFLWNNQLRFDFVISDASVTTISLSTDATSSFSLFNSRVSLTSAQKTTHFLQDITLLYPSHNQIDYTISKDHHSLIFSLKNQYDFAIIDPTFSFASFVGGSASEYIYDVKLLENNRLYAVGYTTSLDFPTTPGAYKTTITNPEVVIYAVDLNTNSLLFSTFIGGVNSEIGYGIDVAQNQVIICGQTNSLNFPMTPGSFSTTFNGGNQDGFVAGLSLNGSTLNFATYVGGSDADVLYKVATNSQGSIIAAGQSRSANFPVGTNPAQFVKNTGNDAVIVSLSPTASLLFGGTFWGGNNEDKINHLSISSNNEIVVVGTTASTNFPMQQAIYANYNGGLSDAFVARFNDNLSTSLFSTYFGGNTNDFGTSIAIDNSNNIILGGTSNSTNLPILNEINKVNQGGNDIFIAKILPNRILDFSTYLGGSNDDNLEDLAVNSAGNIYITGFTTSSNFPISNDAPFPINKGSGDMFISKLYRSGQSLLYSTYFGDFFQDVSTSLSINSSGLVALGGYTQSSTLQTLNAIDSTYNGGLFDAYLMTFFLPDVVTSIQTDSVELSYCKGVRDSVSFTFIGGFERNNTFFVELSDSNGNFSPARVIGNLQSPNPRKISFFIPFDIPSGENYKIRIRASSPATIGSPTIHSIRINTSPIFSLGNDTIICKGNSVELGTMLAMYPIVRWFSNDTTTNDIISQTLVISPQKTTKYWASVIDSNGCSGLDTIEIIVQNPPIGFLPNTIQLCVSDTFRINIPDSIIVTNIIPDDPSISIIDGILTLFSNTDKEIVVEFENKNNGCRAFDTISVKSIGLETISFSVNEFTFPEKQECEQYTQGILQITSTGNSSLFIDSILIDNSSFSFDSIQSIVKRFSISVLPNTVLSIPIYFLGTQNENSIVRLFSSKCVLTDSISLFGSVDKNSVVIRNEINVESSLYCRNNIIDTTVFISITNNTNDSKIISIDTNNITTILFNSVDYNVNRNDSIFVPITFINPLLSSDETIIITIQDSICTKTHSLRIVHTVNNLIREYSVNSVNIDTTICSESPLLIKLPISKVVRNLPILDTLQLIDTITNFSLINNTTGTNGILLSDNDTLIFRSNTTQNTNQIFTMRGVVFPCNDTIEYTVNLNIRYYNPDLFVGSTVTYVYTNDSLEYTILFDGDVLNDIKTLSLENNSSNNVSYNYDSIRTLKITIPLDSISSQDSLNFSWGNICNFQFSIPIIQLNNSIFYTLDTLSSLPKGEVSFTLKSSVISSVFPVVDTVRVTTNKYLLFPLDYQPTFSTDSVEISIPILHTLAGEQTRQIRYLALLGDTTSTQLSIRNTSQIPTVFKNGYYTMLPICDDKEVLLLETGTLITVSILYQNSSQKFLEMIESSDKEIQIELFTLLGQKIPANVQRISENEYTIQPIIYDTQQLFLVLKNPIQTLLIPIYR